MLETIHFEIYQLLAGLPFSDVNSARIGGHIAASIGVAAIAAGVAVASVAAIATISTAVAATVAKAVSPAVTSVAPAVTSGAVASVIGVSYGQRQKAEQDLKNQKKVISRLSRNSSKRETELRPPVVSGRHERCYHYTGEGHHA